MNKNLQRVLGALALLASAAAYAQTTETAPKPKVYALISAVGDQFSYVTQKQQTGSNIIDNYRREVIRVPGNALNASILKGLDRAIEQRDPSSVRILATLRALEMEGVRPVDREKVAMKKLLAALETMPQRQEWDTIIVITPKYQYSARKGMGPKLEGIGVYIQPLESGKVDGNDGDDIVAAEGEETVTPEGAPSKRSSRYVAPYNYTQTWVFDAKTLKVLESSARYEYQKIYDQYWTAIDMSRSMPVEKLAEVLTTFVEKSVARGVGEALPSVEMGEIKPVKSDATKPKS